MPIRFLDEQPVDTVKTSRIRFLDEQPSDTSVAVADAPGEQEQKLPGLLNKLKTRGKNVADVFNPNKPVYGDEFDTPVGESLSGVTRLAGQAGGAMGDVAGAVLGKSFEGYKNLYDLLVPEKSKKDVSEGSKSLLNMLSEIKLPVYTEESGYSEKKPEKLSQIVGDLAKKVKSTPFVQELAQNEPMREFYGDLANSFDIIPGGYIGKKAAKAAPPIIQAARTSTGEAIEGVGKNVIRSSMKPKDVTAKLAGRNVEEGAQKLVDDIAKYSVQSTTGGFSGIAQNAAKRKTEMLSLADNILQDAIKNNSNATIDIDNTFISLIDELQSGKVNSVFGNEERAAEVAGNIHKALELRGLTGQQQIAKIPEIKRAISEGQQLFKKGAYNITQDPINKQVGELSYLKIKDELESFAPGIREPNRAVRDLINVERAALEAKKRIGNKNQIGLTDWIALLGGGAALQSLGVPAQFSTVGPLLASGLITKKALGEGRGGSALVSAGQLIKGNPPIAKPQGKILQMPDQQQAKNLGSLLTDLNQRLGQGGGIGGTTVEPSALAKRAGVEYRGQWEMPQGMSKAAPHEFFDPTTGGNYTLTPDKLGDLLQHVSQKRGAFATGGKPDRGLLRQLGNEAGQIGAYHGSPYKFDKFGPLDKVARTGEGAMAVGHGLYFTDEKDIAKHYKDALSFPEIKGSTSKGDQQILEAVKSTLGDADEFHVFNVARMLKKGIVNNGYDIDGTIRQAKKIISDYSRPPYSNGRDAKLAIKEYTDAINVLEKYKDKIGKSGALYSVTLHKGKTPDQYDYLKWDEPIEKQHIDKIVKAAEQVDKPDVFLDEDLLDMVNLAEQRGADIGGESIYRMTSKRLGSDQAASEFLLRAGIDGIDYPAGSLSGAAGSKARNYVVFDPEAVTIEGVEQGNTGLQMLGGMGGGGVAGGAVGGQVGDTPEERRRNALIGAGAGMIGGSALGPMLAQLAKSKALRSQAGSVGGISDDWYLSGRHPTSQNTVMFSTKNRDVADMYAGKNGDILEWKPNNSTSIFDATDEKQLERIKNDLISEYQANKLPASIEDIIANGEIDKLVNGLNPKNIVEGGETLDESSLWEWLAVDKGIDVVKTHDGALLLNPNNVTLRNEEGSSSLPMLGLTGLGAGGLLTLGKMLENMAGNKKGSQGASRENR